MSAAKKIKQVLKHDSFRRLGITDRSSIHNCKSYTLAFAHYSVGYFTTEVNVFYSKTVF